MMIFGVSRLPQMVRYAERGSITMLLLPVPVVLGRARGDCHLGEQGAMPAAIAWTKGFASGSTASNLDGTDEPDAPTGADRNPTLTSMDRRGQRADW